MDDLWMIAVFPILFFGGWACGALSDFGADYFREMRRLKIQALNFLLTNRSSLKRIAADLEIQADGSDSPDAFLAYCLEREINYLGVGHHDNQ